MESAKKQKLREQIKLARPHSSSGLTQNLIRLTLELNANVIASYWPLDDEPDTGEYNSWVELIGKNLITPRVTGNTMEFASGPFMPGSYGILEPQGQVMNIANADLILVPALAVSQSGERLGKGKGFYDRALLLSQAPKYAVVFESENLISIPSEDHDQKVTGSVSPLAIRHFLS